MVEIEVGGLVYVFESDWKVIEWLDANADEVRETQYE